MLRHSLQCLLTALKAGKHIYCEKPLCLTLEELAEIEEEARTRPSQHLMVGFNRRFAPLVITRFAHNPRQVLPVLCDAPLGTHCLRRLARARALLSPLLTDTRHDSCSERIPHGPTSSRHSKDTHPVVQSSSSSNLAYSMLSTQKLKWLVCVFFVSDVSSSSSNIRFGSSRKRKGPPALSPT